MTNEKKIEKLKEEIQRLREKANSLQDENKALKTALDDKDKKIAELERLAERRAELWEKHLTDTAEAIEAYRRALAELDRVEGEYPERANKPEFATLRNKRAYVNAAIDSLLLGQVKANAKAVAVSDTTELEKKLAAERAAKKGEQVQGVEKAQKVQEVEKVQEVQKVEKPERPLTVRDRVIADIEKGDWKAAELGIQEMLVAKPNDAVALNLKAAMEAEQGMLKEAEETLDRAIMSNPRSPHAYYNMADLMLKRNPPNAGAARRYYETGRTMGGQRDERLEALLK